MTITCACWRCKGYAHDDGTLHGDPMWTFSRVGDGTLSEPTLSNGWNPDLDLLSQRDHYLAGCSCPQRAWCVPHGFAGMTWEHHDICSDHGHVAPNPDPLRPPETDTDPGPRIPWSPPDEPGHVTPVGGWLLICGLILVVLAAIAWRVLR